jgi:hypothetical protein
MKAIPPLRLDYRTPVGMTTKKEKINKNLIIFI